MYTIWRNEVTYWLLASGVSAVLNPRALVVSDVEIYDSHRTSTREPPSTRIVREIAAAEGVDPTALTPPLYDVVDTDAVDALFARSQPTPPSVGTRVTFPYNGYLVRVEDGGDVSVEPLGDEADDRPPR